MTSLLIHSMLFAPALGALSLAVLRLWRVDRNVSATIALGTSLISSFASILWVFSDLNDPSMAPYSFEWIPDFSIRFEVAGDGVTGLLVLLVSLLFPSLFLSEWKRENGRGGILGSLLFLQCFLLGTICSENLFVTLFFWSATALPIFFQVSLWGKGERGIASARSFLFSSLGNAAVLAAVLLYYFATEDRTFSLHSLWGGKESKFALTILGWDAPLTTLSFVLMSLGFFLRLPLSPLHAWLPEFTKTAPPSSLAAYYGAFVPVSLAIFSKFALGLFPSEFQASLGVFLVLGIFNVLYGSIGSLGRKSLREIILRISLTQVGISLVGLCTAGVSGIMGSLLSSVSMSLAMGGIALLIGNLEDRDWNEGSGDLIRRAPGLALLGSLLFASLIQIPGTFGFVSQAVTIMGTYSKFPFSLWILLLGSVLIAWGAISLYRSLFLPVTDGDSDSKGDASLREKIALFPLCFILLFLGIYPKPAFDLIRPAAEKWVSWMR